MHNQKTTEDIQIIVDEGARQAMRSLLQRQAENGDKMANKNAFSVRNLGHLVCDWCVRFLCYPLVARAVRKKSVIFVDAWAEDRAVREANIIQDDLDGSPVDYDADMD